MTVTLRWPFWAPTPDASIEQALDMARLRPGERLLDLGCGDGRVLEAAVRRGAGAVGYEADPLRAKLAQERLAPLNGAARVEVADFHSAPLDADVIFAFLSPATLYRLRPRFAALAPGTRIVTYGYGLTGWAAERHKDGCFLYSLPARSSRGAFRPGWQHAAVVVAGPPRRTVLVGLPFGARAGALDPEVSTNLDAFAAVYPGALSCDADMSVPVDIKLTLGAEGTLQLGGVRVQGRELLVAVVGGGETMQRRHVALEEHEAFRRALREVRAGRLAPLSLLAEPEP